MSTNTPDTFDTGDTSDDIDAIAAQDWAVRAFVFAFIVANERPPTVEETATALGFAANRAELAYLRLDRRHALFLEPHTLTIRMAHPFSGVTTPFRVRANGHIYSANCAWDMLGIAAALQADADIEAHYAADPGDSARLRVRGGQLRGDGGIIHFPLPFRRWYDDLIDT